MGTSNGLDKSEDDLLYFPVPNLTKPELDREGRVHVTLNGKDITVISHKNGLYAIQQVCPHRGGDLKIGQIEDIPGPGACIRCPYHGWKFDLTRGRCISPQSRLDVTAQVYPVKVRCPEHTIWVGFKAIAPEIFNEIPP